MKRISDHERKQAWAKFDNAGFTKRQKDIITRSILNKALSDAETQIQNTKRDDEGNTWRIIPMWSLSHGANPAREITKAVYWFHDTHNHFWK